MIAIKAPDVFRSEVRVQTIPVRQKPPRTSKSKAPSSAASDVGVAPVSLTPTPAVAVASAAGETASLSRIKTSSIVDRHFGHVIRVTHHHHPALHAMRPSRHYSPVSGVATAGGDAFDSLSAVTKLSGVSSVSVDQPQRHVNERPPPSPTEVIAFVGISSQHDDLEKFFLFFGAPSLAVFFRMSGEHLENYEGFHLSLHTIGNTITQLRRKIRKQQGRRKEMFRVFLFLRKEKKNERNCSFRFVNLSRSSLETVP